MKIAPIDIAHKTFARKVMGLDTDEVSDFLRDVADQMEEIIRERNALKEHIRQKEMQILEYRERDDSLKATITTATRMSEQIRMDSEREAKLIINDAQQKAEMILKDCRDSLKRIYQEISDLKRTRMQFEANLRSVCGAHLSMLDQSHMMLPDPQINLAQAAASLNPGASMHAAQTANQNMNQLSQQNQYNQAASARGNQNQNNNNQNNQNHSQQHHHQNHQNHQNQNMAANATAHAATAGASANAGLSIDSSSYGAQAGFSAPQVPASSVFHPGDIASNGSMIRRAAGVPVGKA